MSYIFSPKRIIFWIIILSISACKPSPSPILQSPCEPPCWNNITPGITAKEEMLEILESSPVIKPDSIEVRGSQWKIFSDIIRFQLISNGEVEIYTIDDIVILLNFYGELRITFGEAMDKIGEPKDLLVFQSFGPGFLFGEAMHTIVLVYNFEKGISYGYDAYYLKQDWRDEIKPEIKLRFVDYFSPDYYQQLLEAGALGIGDAEKTLSRMQPWQGYGTLPEK